MLLLPPRLAGKGKRSTVSIIRRSPDGTWNGDMLDPLSFVKVMKDRGARLEGARMLLVGDGGAGSAIAVVPLESGVGDLLIHDADQSRVSAPLLELLSEISQGRARPGSPDPTGCDLVCNPAPMGPAEGDPPPLEASRLSPSMFVGDVIARHGVTRLIRRHTLWAATRPTAKTWLPPDLNRR